MLPERFRDTGVSAPGSLPRRRILLNGGLGVGGLGYAIFLAAPKVAALMAGNLDVLGVGAIANLGLAFGSLMFLRAAQRAARGLPAEPRSVIVSSGTTGDTFGGSHERTTHSGRSDRDDAGSSFHR